MVAKIVDFDIDGVDELRERLPLVQPVNELDKCVSSNNGADNKVGLVILVAYYVQQGEYEAGGLQNEQVDEQHEVVLRVRLLLV
jgi:hypothetical protein